MIIIPEEHRLNELPTVKVIDIPTLKDALVEYLESHDLKIVPLRQMCARWHSKSRTQKVKLNDILSEMAAEGRCAVKYLESLRRTYVLAPSLYAKMLDEARENHGYMDWEAFAKSLEDLK